MSNKIRVSWSEVFKFVSDLKNFCSGKQFDCILAVARGGSIIGTLLSYQLNIPIRYVGISSYNGDKKTDEMRFTQHAEIGDYKNILVVDDIVDTGDTINFIKNIIALNSFDRQFTYATMYTVTGKQEMVDFKVAVKQQDEWIEFPWEI
jgi:hypoxanthine phosphoribosyltransferase